MWLPAQSYNRGLNCFSDDAVTQPYRARSHLLLSLWLLLLFIVGLGQLPLADARANLAANTTLTTTSMLRTSTDATLEKEELKVFRAEIVRRRRNQNVRAAKKK